MWDTGNQLGDVSGPTKRVLSCAFRPSRPFRVVTASEDFGVAHFKGPPFKFDKTPHRHRNYVNCVRYNADGSLFATVGSDGVGVICEGTEGAPAARIPGKAKAPPRWMKKKPGSAGDDEEEGHVGTVYACAWAPPGAEKEKGAKNVLVTVGADKTVRVWRVPEDLRVDAANDDDAPPRAVADLPACASVRATSFGDSVGDMCVGCAFVDATRVAVLTLDGAIRIERVDDAMTGAQDSEERDADASTSSASASLGREGETTRVLLSRGHPKPVVAMAGAGLGAVHAASLAGDAATCGGRSVVYRWSESRDPRNGASVALPESAGAVRAMAAALRTGRVFAVGVDDGLRWYDDAHSAAEGLRETAAA
jgi:WD40 repeat protein